MKFAFFGTPELAATALEEMKTFGVLPSLIVTSSDAPVGRKQIITPPPVKIWGKENSISVFQPASLKDRAQLEALTKEDWDFFVVFAYGKIMPEWLLNLPKYGTINAHPSLLPKLRGASPIRSTLLTDLGACGVTIMQMDKDLDHGPILLQQAVALERPVPGRGLDKALSLICGDLLVHVMQEVVAGNLIGTSQDHDAATFCTKITKDMAELTLDPHALPTGDAAVQAYKKICAFDGWPEAFFIHHEKRIKIKDAALKEDGTLTILRIVPEGKAEMNFSDYFK